MTVVEAIERVSRWLDKGKQHEDNQLGYAEGWFTKEDEQAFQMAIQAMQKDSCEDCISRQTIKEQMIKYGFHAPDMTVTEFIEDLPSIQSIHNENIKITPKKNFCSEHMLEYVGMVCPSCSIKRGDI